VAQPQNLLKEFFFEKPRLVEGHDFIPSYQTKGHGVKKTPTKKHPGYTPAMSSLNLDMIREREIAPKNKLKFYDIFWIKGILKIIKEKGSHNRLMRGSLMTSRKGIL